MGTISKIARLLRRPWLIPERLAEKFMNRQAQHFYAHRSVAENDSERAAYFSCFGDISDLVAEARALPVFDYLTASEAKNTSMARIAASQTTSVDDCVTMYVLVRLLKPRVMVETGVFYGGLSATILYAMVANDGGQLYSIDLPVVSDGLDPAWRGGLVPVHLRNSWELILGDSRVELPKLLDRLGQIDAFNHDSLHTTRHMTWEYETAWPHITLGGFLSSHDVLTTPSWSRFCKQHEAEIKKSGRVFGLGIAQKA